MERKQLNSTLSELHEHLAAAPAEIDEETRTLLKQLATDISVICEPNAENTGDAESPDPDEKQGMLDQLLNLTEEFEESHPQLAETIGRIATALSRIGI